MSAKRPTVGSLFAGIGGIDLGLERAGFQTVWQVEKDEYASKVLAKHWPHVARYRDVRYFLGGKRWRRVRSAWSVDLIAGGFPCQDISNAGTRVGIEGERSGLWSEYARVIRLLRPRYVLVENVAALAIRGLDRVLGGLAECGYDAEWFCLPASAFGAPYERDRLFVVAESSGRNVSRWRRAFSVKPNAGESGPFQVPTSDSHRSRLPNPERERQFRGPIARSDWWATEPNVVRMVSGVPDRVDRIRGLGNCVIPQVAEWIGRRLLETMR